MGADIWYGFHIFLIPFTYFSDLVFGIKVAGAFITFSALVLFFWAISRLKIKLVFLWPVFLLAASPDLLYRLTMTRPHNISLGLGFFVFSFLIKGGIFPILIASAFLSFIHIALAWIPLLLALIVLATKKVKRQPLEWKKIGMVFAGVILGILARPNPWGAIKLAYIQVVGILAVKLNQIPLYFGRELKSLEFYGFIQNVLPILIILALTWALLRKKISFLKMENEHLRLALFACLVIITMFLIITAALARRGYDMLISYGVIAAAILVDLYLQKNPSRRNIILSAAIIIIGLMSLNTVPFFKQYMAKAWQPNYLKESALWLKENARPGEIVFNARWDQFPGLFFWNPNNYYIGGMDPIFQYAYDESFYWKAHFLAIDKADKLTCGKIRCIQKETEDTHAALVNDFKASYLFLRQSQNPKLYFYLAKTANWPLVFDNQREAIFKIPPL